MQICLCIFAVVANAQYFPQLGFYPAPFFPLPFLPQIRPLHEEYAASLGGAKVGLYGKNNFGPYGPGFGYGFPGPYGGGARGSDVTGASLGGAKVGVYGKDRPRI